MKRYLKSTDPLNPRHFNKAKAIPLSQWGTQFSGITNGQMVRNQRGNESRQFGFCSAPPKGPQLVLVLPRWHGGGRQQTAEGNFWQLSVRFYR